MDLQQNVVAVVLQVSVALAGLLLVFVGFVYSRGESFGTKRGDKFKHTARAGVVLFGLLLLCAWLSLNYLNGDVSAYFWAIFLFRSILIITALYAFVVFFVYL
jgi:uncharacterized membrane protein